MPTFLVQKNYLLHTKVLWSKDKIPLGITENSFKMWKIQSKNSFLPSHWRAIIAHCYCTIFRCDSVPRSFLCRPERKAGKAQRLSHHSEKASRRFNFKIWSMFFSKNQQTIWYSLSVQWYHGENHSFMISFLHLMCQEQLSTTAFKHWARNVDQDFFSLIN